MTVKEEDLLPIPKSKAPLLPNSVWAKYFEKVYRDLLEGTRQGDIIRKYEAELDRPIIARLITKAFSHMKASHIVSTVNEEILEHVAPVLKENAMLAATAANQALTKLNASGKRIKELTPQDISSLSKVAKEQLELSKLEKGEATKIIQVEPLKDNKGVLTVIVESLKSDPVLTDADE